MKKRLAAFMEIFLTLKPGQGIACAGMMMGFILVGDSLTDYQLSLSHVYILPVLVLAWNSGLRWAWVGAALSAALALGVDLVVGYPYTSLTYLGYDIGSVLMVLAIAAAITSRLREKHDLLAIASATDQLTGIANRAGFEDRAALELARQRRYGGPLTVVLIDCDNFKRVNDTAGHAEGDRLLAAVGESLKSSLRETDLPARLGGDEFAVLLPRTGADEAAVVVNKLRHDLALAMRTRCSRVTFSIGSASYASRVPADISEALSMADSLMYEAKAGGKATLRMAVA